MRFTFSKDERLCHQKTIDRLFTEGRAFTEYPVRAIWVPAELDTPYPAQVVMSVPKRKVRKAVGRNRIKRQMREAYRLNKEMLYAPMREKGAQVAFMLIFLGSEPVPYKRLETKIILSLQRLSREYDKGDK